MKFFLEKNDFLYKEKQINGHQFIIEFEWSENELNMAKHMENTIQKSIKAANGEIKNINELMNIPLSLITKI